MSISGRTYRVGNSNFRNLALAQQARSKLANIGGDQESSFEQAFSSLAYTYIRDRAPRLLDFMIGFQLVDRNDDNTKAVGIFGFKVAGSWIYAPVFFINGDLKGHELMYLKEQDMFVPMKENWVNYVMAKKPHVLGQAEPRDLREIGVLQPDIRSLSIPPHSNKYGSADACKASVAGWQDWCVPFAPMYGALVCGRGEYSLEKFGGLSTSDMLKQVVREHVNICKYAMDLCDRTPAVGQAMRLFHGPDFFRSALLDLKKTAQQPLQRKMSSVLDANRKLRTGFHKLSGVLDTLRQVKNAAGPKVQIVVDDDLPITENGPQLSEQEQERLLRDGHLIRDHRAGEEVSKAYNTQVEIALTNPDATGLYEILQKPGEFVKSVIIANPHGAAGRKDFATAVRLDPKDWINAHRTTLYAKPNTSTREDWQKWFDGLENATPEKDGVYVVVSRDRQGSLPFRVEKLLDEQRYGVHFFDYADRDRPNFLPATDQSVAGEFDDSWKDYGYGDEKVYLNDREGTSFRSMQGTLYVPAEHKVISVKKPEKPKKDEPAVADADTQSEDSSFDPGSLLDLQMMVVQKTARMKIYCDHIEASIGGGPMRTKRATLFSLVRNHGLREREAKRMLKQAEVDRVRGNPTYFFIKYAQGYPMMGPGPAAPAIPDPSMNMDSMYGNVPAQYMETQQLPVEGMDSSLTDPEVYNPLPDAMPDPMAMQTAQQAGQLGQKEVFDTAMITGLLKAVRKDSLVERYMGDLLKALDRLGRLLFLFYWHSDEFSDRYGKGDMPELEDSLRNAFEGLGDLTLFLKEKDVEPLRGGHLGGEPDVEESANV